MRRLRKGSRAAKAYMARLRAMQGRRPRRKQVTTKSARRGRRNPAVSESRTLDAIRDLLYRANRARSFQQSRRMVSEAIGLATLLRDQAAAGVHENPTLVLVGANPRSGQYLGDVKEIRYLRKVGADRNVRFKHAFKRRACLYAMPDGSIRVVGH
jgi:hypothetical protein